MKFILIYDEFYIIVDDLGQVHLITTDPKVADTTLEELERAGLLNPRGTIKFPHN